jgi:hypothetical protein
MTIELPRLSLLLVLAPAIVFAPSPVQSEGAVALAKPQSIAEGGWAVGISWNWRSGGEAKRRAMTECRSVQETPAETRKLCKIVTHFRNQCAAIAKVSEFQGSSPVDDVGFGWAVAPTKRAAEEQALAMCRATDRQGNAKSCFVSLTGCDGSAR